VHGSAAALPGRLPADAWPIYRQNMLMAAAVGLKLALRPSVMEAAFPFFSPGFPPLGWRRFGISMVRSL